MQLGVGKFPLALVMIVTLIATHTDRVSAITELEAEQLSTQSLVRIDDVPQGMFIGMGVVIDANANSSYILTASHVLHQNTTYCPGASVSATADPFPTVNLQLAFLGLASRKNFTGVRRLVKEDRCNDLALLEVTEPNMGIGCFTSSFSGTPPIEITGPIVQATVPTPSGTRNLLGETIIKGKLLAWYSTSKVLLHNAVGAPGFSGTGILDPSTGLYFGIHRGIADGSNGTKYIAATTDAVAAFVTGTSASLTTVSGGILPRRCFGHL